MNMNLFSSIQDGKNFLLYKAAKRIIELEELLREDEKEISESIIRCQKVFEKYDTENLIEKYFKVEEEIQNTDAQSITTELFNELNRKREEVASKLVSFLDTLLEKYNSETVDLALKTSYLSDKEDIEFEYKKVVNRIINIQKNQATIEAILELFPTAREFDIEKYRSESPIFKQLGLSQVKKDAAEALKPKEEISSDDLYVVRISKAPEELIEQETFHEVQVPLEDSSEELTADTSFFGIDDGLTDAILNGEDVSVKIETENKEAEEAADVIVEKAEPEVVQEPDSKEEPTEEAKEDKEEKAEPVKEEEPSLAEESELVEPRIIEEPKLDVIVMPEEPEETDEKEPDSKEEQAKEAIEPTEEVKEEPKEENAEPTQLEEETAPETETVADNNEETEKTAKEEVTQEEDTSLSYTMSEKDTLYDFALALFQDEKLVDSAIQKIYEENQDIISKRLEERNITDLDNIEKMPGLFEGLTLELSTVFDRVIEDAKKVGL